MQEKEPFSSLIERYEAALKEYGLSPSSRLVLIIRANVIIRLHENQGREELDGNIISDYINEISNKHLRGEVGREHWIATRRTTERFLHFTMAGSVEPVNPTKGSQCILLTEFKLIVDEFLEKEGFHPNTRNDARWVVHKYFAWLAEQGYNDLRNVGADQIQNFLLNCAQNLAMNSVHNIKLYLTRCSD